MIGGKKRELVPILDLAYQGFAEGTEADATPVRRFIESMNPVFVASSFSKTFSLYGERVGALLRAQAAIDVEQHRGDRVVVTTFDHNAVLRPAAALAALQRVVAPPA